MHKKSHSGFTLVELMVVVAIIAILAVAGIAGYSVYIKRARDSRRRTDVQAIAQDLVNFRMDRGRYPSIGEFFLQKDEPDSKLYAFSGGQYVKNSSLVSPDNKTCYTYCCLTSGTEGQGQGQWHCTSAQVDANNICDSKSSQGSTNRCSQFAVCAKLENRNGNVDFSRAIAEGEGTNPTTGEGRFGASLVDFDNLIEDSTNDFYCATSP